MATHSALRFHGNKDLRLETVARPRPGPRQVLVKVDFCAVCQTDVEEFVRKLFLHGSLLHAATKVLIVLSNSEPDADLVARGK